MTVNIDPYPPHKKLYQDIFDWCQSCKGLPLESEMDDLIAIITAYLTTPNPQPSRAEFRDSEARFTGVRDGKVFKGEKPFSEEIKEAQPEYHEKVLDLVEDMKFIRGIVEKGTGKKLADDEKIAPAVLAYVQELERRNPQPVSAALEALERIYEIRAESHGVSGYHRNGDIASWDEFQFDEDYIVIKQALTQNAQGWQPIETAPELEEIMVYRYRAEGIWWGVVKDGQVAVRFGADWIDADDVAHWMPLPAAPAADRGE